MTKLVPSYEEAAQVVADAVASLVSTVDAAAEELKRQREEFEAAEAAEATEAQGDEDSVGEVAVEADGQAAAPEAVNAVTDDKADGSSDVQPLLDAASLSKLRTMATGATTHYLDVMKDVLNDGLTVIPRQVNEIRNVDTPRPRAMRYRLEVLEVFARELF